MHIALKRGDARPQIATIAAHGWLVGTTFAWGPAIWSAAGLSLLAGWAHMAYVSTHFHTWWAYGVFFLVAAIGQAAFAAVILRWPNPLLALIGIAGNLAIVGMYVDSRTIGVPLGPDIHLVEYATAPDILTTVAEVVLICVLLSLVYRSRKARNEII